MAWQKSINKYRVLTALVIILFSGTIVFNTAFLHIHKKSDGSIVIHSHFNRDAKPQKESESPSTAHSHSNSEYNFYNDISHYDKFALVSVPCAPIYFENRTNTYIDNSDLNSFIFYASPYLRAPPAC